MTTKVAQQWQDDFDQQVNVLIKIVSKVDTESIIDHATELMNVYHHTALATSKRKGKKLKQDLQDKPFEFIVFRN